eukprot:2079934-Rhodomonas_salina.3
MSSTDIAYGGTRPTECFTSSSLPPLVSSAIRLRARYAMPGTDRTDVAYARLGAKHTRVCDLGTDVAYMGLPDVKFPRLPAFASPGAARGGATWVALRCLALVSGMPCSLLTQATRAQYTVSGTDTGVCGATSLRADAVPSVQGQDSAVSCDAHRCGFTPWRDSDVHLRPSRDGWHFPRRRRIHQGV